MFHGGKKRGGVMKDRIGSKLYAGAFALALVACGQAEGANAEGEASGEAAAFAAEPSASADTTSAIAPAASLIAFDEPLECRPSAELRDVLIAMASGKRDDAQYGMMVVTPGQVILPDGSRVTARKLSDGEYAEQGVFLPLGGEYAGLELRGIWISDQTHAILSGNLASDGAHYRVYFASDDAARAKLGAAGWKFSRMMDPDYGPETVNSWNQQYYLDNNQPLAEPIDFEAAVNRNPNRLPQKHGRDVGNYAMETIVSLEESRSMDGTTYMECMVYANT